MMNQEKRKKNLEAKVLWQETLKGLRTWYIANLFVILTMIVFLTYYAFSVYKVSLSNFWVSVFSFLTSPFNLTEVFAKVYSSPVEGYFFNGIFTFVLIIFCIIYFHLFASSKRVTPEFVFWMSIVASYVVSALVWFFTGAPSTGTSIVGFCMVGFLLVSSMNDLRVYFSKKIRHTSKLSIIKVTTITAIAIFSLIFAILFYSLGENAYVHFVGGAICAFLIFVMIKLRRLSYKNRNLDSYANFQKKS